MTSSYLLLGGARSGKSRNGEKLALSLSPRPAYVATSRVWDDDHRARIERHRRDRDPAFEVFEEEKFPSRLPLDGRVVLVDCLTLLLTNYFVDDTDRERALASAKEELERMLAIPATWILVSNEVGMSLHAETEVGRKFTDAQGFLNQFVAAKVETVLLVVAGLPLAIKGTLPETSR